MKECNYWLELIGATATLLEVIVWPIVAIIVLYAIKQPTIDLLSRIRTFEFGPNKANFDLTSQNAGRIEYKVDVLASTEALGQENSEHDAINPLKTQLIKIIEDQFASELRDQSPEQAKSILLTALAKERLDKIFAMVYADIFGSQIHALQLMIDMGGFVSWVVADHEFRTLQEKQPVFEGWDLKRYLRFLMHFQLIAQNEEGVSITDYGREFLAFLDKNGLSRNRPH